MKRVALVHSILFFGSTEWYLDTLVRRLDPDAFELWLVLPDHPSLAPLRDLEALRGRVVTLPVSHATGASAPRAVWTYRRALRRLRPDLVHAVDVDPPAMLAARLAGVRRLAVTYHTPEHRPRDNLAGRLVRRAGWLTRPHVIFTSEPDRETGLRLDPIAGARSSVISFGIDFDRFSPAVPSGLREALPAIDGRRVVGTVGLLRPQKAHERLIGAAAEVVRAERDVAFVVVGDGPLRSSLEQRVRDAGLSESFFFLGQREDVPRLVAGFDVFALSSDFEGMCLAVAEAMAMEKPVVATAVGGVRQSVVDGETGLLVPPRDTGALANALLWMLRHREDAARMGRAGGARARRLYALDRMVDETAAVYRRLLA